MSRTPTDGLWREQLPNGVTLLVQRRKTAPAATLVSHIRAGFLDEPDSVVGISHVLEHMLFKGTATLAPGELAQRTKAIGGALNAYTSYDRTVYYASVPAQNIAELIRLQADQVQNASLDADELRRELGVIIQEARRKLDSPGAVAGETLHELLYADHRIRRWRIGYDEMLEKFTRDDVASYYQSRYVPSRVIVSLAGDVDEAHAMSMLRDAWGGWNRPEVPIDAGPVETSIASVHARRMNGDVALAEVVLGWRAPGILDTEVPALEVASAILGLGRASRFSRSLREPGLVNSIGVGSYGVVDAGIFSIGIELDPERLHEVIGVIGNAVRALAAKPVPDAEFARAVTMMRARIGRRLERFESRAVALADAESYGDVTRIDREEAELLAVTPDAVQCVMAKWILPEFVSAVAYLPRASDVPFDAATLATAIAATGSSTLHPLAIVLPNVNTGATAASERGEVTGQVHHRAVGNVDILTARFGETGQTSLHFYRPRLVPVTAENAGLPVLAVRAMVRGTQQLDASALGFAMESLGGSLGPSVGSDVLGFGTTVLSENVARASALLRDVLLTPRFDSANIAIERSILLDDARAVADDMVRFPVQLALGVAFGATDYGAPTLGTPESIATFSDDIVRAWHQEMISGGRTTIIAVGDADPEQLADDIAAAIGNDFSALAARAGATSRSKLTIMPGVQTETRDRKQSALAMLFPGPARNDHQRFAAETWSAIAAGLGGRLFESLRSKRSLAYTVIANSWQRKRAGGLLTYIAMEPSRLTEARDAMLEELAAFTTTLVSPEELQRATASIVGQIEMSRQTAGEFAGEIADAWLLGDGLQDLENPAAPYLAVTAEAIRDVAAAAFDPSLRAEGVVAAEGRE